MLPRIDTKSAPAIAAIARGTFRRMYPGADSTLIDVLFRDTEAMFKGRYLDYLTIDMDYHDLEHTLQAALCIIKVLDGRHTAGAAPFLTSRHFELAMAAVLLHDSGYLKLRSDYEGTGAKYTFVHVLRSCAFAASYLPTVGFRGDEAEAVAGIIRCTGPRSDITHLHFTSEIEHLLGSALATADYLGQMAASDYVDELPILFAEFDESEDFLRTPAEKRFFKSVGDLIRKTPGFWEKVVLPKLNIDFQGLYRFLADPYPDGPNAYILAVEENIARARALATAPEISLDPFPKKKAKDSRSPSLPTA